MDPATIVGLVSSAVGLAMACGNAAKDLNALVSKYKNAKLAVLSMVQGLDTMQLAWSRIGNWAQNQTPDGLLEEDDFIGRLRRSLETGSLVMDALREELLIYQPVKMGLTQRTKVVWNEGTLKSHQERIRDQASSMTLLLQSINLPTLRDRNDLLQESAEQFKMSDESAYSIVPSHVSRSIYTIQTTDSGASKGEEDLVYKPLTFENELFTARVYKRNYRTLEFQRLFKDTKQKPSDKTRPRIVAQENVEDSHDSKSENLTIRETKSTPLWYTKAQSTTLLPTKGQPVGHKDTRGGINTSPNAEPRLSFAEACEQGNVEIVETFLESGQDVHVPEVPDMSAVHLAAKGGHIQIAKILLSYGADKEMLSRVSRKRPLHLAVQAGHVAMVRYLLDNGTNIAARDGLSAQAIHVAAACGSTRILSFLLECGAAIDSAMTNGARPLHVASQIPDRADVIKLLWSQGADIEAESNHGCTPLYYASLYNCVDNMKALLELGAAHSPQGPSILSAALERGSVQSTRLLLERGVHLNRPDSRGRTALHRLLRLNTGLCVDHYRSPKDAEIVELLLLYGADVDCGDSNGDTPLHCLCSPRNVHLRYETYNEQRYVQISLAKILSRSMRDVDTVNLAGRTALGVSMEQKSKSWLSRSLFDSGARLLLRIPHIEIGLNLKRSCTGYKSILTFYLRQGSNTLTRALGYYGQDPQDRIIKFHKAPTALLRHFLRDPESLDLEILYKDRRNWRAIF